MLGARIHEIRKTLDQNINLIRNPTLQQPIILELEAKYGHYSGDRFNSNVPYVHYERLLNRLRSMPNIVVQQPEESTVAQAGDIRRITTTNIGDGPETVLWQRKRRIRDIELNDYDIRISINTEEELVQEDIPETFNAVVTRERTRNTFVIANGIVKVDMTEVMMRGEDQVMRPRYEVEVEHLGTGEDLGIFSQQVEYIFKLLRGTNIMYTNQVKNLLIRDTNRILGGDRDDMISKDVLVEARNIKRRDLVYGGIVGNQRIDDEKMLAAPRRPGKIGSGTNYMITYKADGLRKILIIHTTGVWLVYPPYEFNLVLNSSLNIPQLDKFIAGFNGTVFDGELVIPRIPKNISYWYLAFDCLAFRGSAGIQLQPFTERQRVVSAIAAALKTPILTVDTKETREIRTPEEFFLLVSQFLDRRDDLEYDEDGLMFIPIDTRYNPHSQRYKLHERSLTHVPDICKWKEGADITIDFALKWVEGGRLELHSYDEVTKTTVAFRGDVINPLTPDMIDHTHELTRNKQSNLVVEYEWIRLNEDTKERNQGILRPRRIRYDKQGPNRLSIALDDWEDIMNPITASDITGQTLTMTFSYHNRIKRSLYNVLTLNPNFNPRVKTTGKKFLGANILDLGSGYGGDANKWLRLVDKDNQDTTGFIVAVEPNDNNRLELVNRVNTFGLQDKVAIVPTGAEDTVTITDVVRRHIPGGKVDAVTLMLSMSFFWASDSHLDALVSTIVNNLKPGGKVLFLTINGDTVEQLFEPALGGPHVDDITIATARMHLYPRRQPPFGRPLDFILPDTIVGDQHEYIVHLQDFTTRLSAYGIYLHELHRADGEKLLSEENALFSSMYSFGYYQNDDKTALIQHEQTGHLLANILLPVIPLPTKSPAIQMNLDPTSPTITILATPLPIPTPRSPTVLTPVQSPGLPRLPSPQMPLSPRIQTPVSPRVQTPTSPRAQTPTSPRVQTPIATPISPRAQQTQMPTIVIPPFAQTNMPIIPINQMGGIPVPTVPKPTKFQIENNQLRWLSVTYTGRGGHIVQGAARNDDTYAPLACTWYNNNDDELIRIATIGDGSCFIHAVLKAFYRAYQENNGARYRLDLAMRIRRDLAVALGLENPQYPGRTYWETSARGSFPRMVMQQINDEDLVRDLRVDYSLAGLQRLFNSTSQLGDEVYTFVADAFNMDIYILRATREDLYPHYHTRRPGINRNAVVIIGNMYHYEVLGINTNNGIQTVFPPGDPFLDILTQLFIGDGDFDDIINAIPYDPDTAFIGDFVDAFTTQNGLEIPTIIDEIFPEKDPFKLTLDRLTPRIQDIAQMRGRDLAGTQERATENRIIERLNQILRIMEESGYTPEESQQIRQIVEHKLTPGIDQDLEALVSAAETDGLLNRQQVEDILNVQATL